MDLRYPLFNCDVREVSRIQRNSLQLKVYFMNHQGSECLMNGLLRTGLHPQRF